MLEQGRRIGRNVPQSETVNVREFLECWKVEAYEAVRPKQHRFSEKEKFDLIVQKMGVEEEVVKELASVCDPRNLLCGDEPKSRKAMLEMPQPPENCELECVHDRTDFSKSSQQYKVAAQKQMKYTHMDEYIFVRPEEEICLKYIPDNKRVTVPNVILSVQITKCLVQNIANNRIRPSETLLVLGTQTLADLKDAIRCPFDDVIAGDHSCLPDSDPSQLMTAKDIYQSGFFFIENVFYNDLRYPDNKDYSKPIREWYKGIWGEGSQLKVADMAKTQFLDLQVKLGCYYLFTHQGNCEHSVLFEDVRLLSSEDAHDATLYPIQIAERMKARKLCQGCSKNSGKWIVFDSPLIPTDPCIFCKYCFKTLLYTKDGHKTSNFKAHHYADNCL